MNVQSEAQNSPEAGQSPPPAATTTNATTTTTTTTTADTTTTTTADTTTTTTADTNATVTVKLPDDMAVAEREEFGAALDGGVCATKRVRAAVHALFLSLTTDPAFIAMHGDDSVRAACAAIACDTNGWIRRIRASVVSDPEKTDDDVRAALKDAYHVIDGVIKPFVSSKCPDLRMVGKRGSGFALEAPKARGAAPKITKDAKDAKDVKDVKDANSIFAGESKKTTEPASESEGERVSPTVESLRTVRAEIGAHAGAALAILIDGTLENAVAGAAHALASKDGSDSFAKAIYAAIPYLHAVRRALSERKEPPALVTVEEVARANSARDAAIARCEALAAEAREARADAQRAWAAVEAAKAPPKARARRA